MDNVITYRNGKTTASTVEEAMRRMEDEGGIAVTPPPEVSPDAYSNVMQRLKKILSFA